MAWCVLKRNEKGFTKRNETRFAKRNEMQQDLRTETKVPQNLGITEKFHMSQVRTRVGLFSLSYVRC